MLKRILTSLLAACAVLTVASLLLAAEPANSAKLVVDGKAKDNGQVKIAFTPAGGEKKEVSVTIQKKMSRDNIARDLAKELTVALGSGYKVDRYDPDKIKIEKAKTGSAFTLEIVGVTVPGVTVMMK